MASLRLDDRLPSQTAVPTYKRCLSSVISTMLIQFILGLAGSIANVLSEGYREKQSENHMKLVEIMSCVFSLNFPFRKAETKMMSQMNSALYFGIGNKNIQTRSAVYIRFTARLPLAALSFFFRTRWSHTPTSL